jgi:glycosyltransferase involved in cell wall biosynthesis
MTPPRVLLVANTLPPRDVSGVGEQVLQLAAGLRERGCEVEILGRGPGGVVGPKVLFPLFAVPAVWLALRRFRPHVVQVHESDGGLAALLVAILAPLLDPAPRLVALLQVSYIEELRAVRPLVFQGRVLGRPGGVERRFRWLKAPLQILLGSLTATVADLVLAPSAATAEEIRRDYKVERPGVLPNVTGWLAVEGAANFLEQAPEGRSTVARDGNPGWQRPTASFPPGVPTPGYRGSPLRGSKLAPGGPGGEGPEEPGFFLFVGRLRIRKGVEVLLEAMKILRDRHPEARLLIAGDGEHRGSLERRAAELELGPVVRFLGRCDAARVRGLLRGARALVVPSIYEGMPLVVLEAMEAGVPVIASEVSGIPEVVEDGGTGWLVLPEDPGDLADALAEALVDPAEAARRGEAGRRRVEERFRPAHAAAAWMRLVLGYDTIPGP